MAYGVRITQDENAITTIRYSRLRQHKVGEGGVVLALVYVQVDVQNEVQNHVSGPRLRFRVGSYFVCSAFFFFLILIFHVLRVVVVMEDDGGWILISCSTFLTSS